MAVQVPAEEFVVEGAKMSCDKGSRNAVFKPPADRRMTILGGRITTCTRSSIHSGLSGSNSRSFCPLSENVMCPPLQHTRMEEVNNKCPSSFGETAGGALLDGAACPLL